MCRTDRLVLCARNWLCLTRRTLPLPLAWEYSHFASTPSCTLCNLVGTGSVHGTLPLPWGEILSRRPPVPGPLLGGPLGRFRSARQVGTSLPLPCLTEGMSLRQCRNFASNCTGTHRAGTSLPRSRWEPHLIWMIAGEYSVVHRIMG